MGIENRYWDHVIAELNAGEKELDLDDFAIGSILIAIDKGLTKGQYMQVVEESYYKCLKAGLGNETDSHKELEERSKLFDRISTMRYEK